MSFILDALRKAEHKNRDRHKITVPDGPRVLDEELPQAPPAERNPVWLFGITCILLAGIIWWFLPTGVSNTPTTQTAAPLDSTEEQSPQALTTPSKAGPAPNSTVPAESVTERRSSLRETGARALDREVRRAQPSSSANTQTTSAKVETETTETDSNVQRDTPVKPGTVRILEPNGVDSRPAQGRVSDETLPEYRGSLTSGDVPLPQLHLDMHVFSQQPTKRFVFINLEKYVEGDDIDKDTKIESIEPEGAVINHKGFRFVLRPE